MKDIENEPEEEVTEEEEEVTEEEDARRSSLNFGISMIQSLASTILSEMAFKIVEMATGN